jgi:hypothetical protein
MMRCTWVLSLLLLILPACLHNSQARVIKEENINYRLRALSLEAKYNDIPVPLGSEPLYGFFKSSSEEKGIVFGYTNKTDATELYGYFKAEFLRLGWSFMGGIQDIESMLTFEKPDRVCSVSLRPREEATALIIMVYPKDGTSGLKCS